MSARIIDGEAFTIEQIAERLGVVNATVRNRLAQAKKPYTWDALQSRCRKSRKPAKQWRTGEDRLARAAYLIGGAQLVHKLLPNRSIRSIACRANEFEWELWTRFKPGSEASKAVEMAMDHPITSTDLAAEIDRSSTHAAAVIGNLFRRGVLERKPYCGGTMYIYSISQRYRDAYNETQVP
ncbi:hypothetical protein KEM14_gp60 [Xanthomonas virus phiXaf18]|uniref:Uncharacterized protein n=1 Tax=Xanthomonas virus phiXaf18 TaxID=2653651 RepID=A0A5P8PQP0_9CAUD|nr:hypothetical protein KEM14_gp60 [Xanthomonas virus phiXaf18]QFR59575.1 hypothetical protein phiXaf18_60 [Xanthomonas virus phiXaf18]